LKPAIGQLTARRRVVRRAGLRSIELDRPIDPRCDGLKWIDGVPLTVAKEGDRVLPLARDADASQFTVGSTVYVTDGPTAANEARGEFRTLAGVDSVTKAVMLDRALRFSYREPALVRVKPVRDVTLRNLTIAQPIQPDSTATSIKYCTGWRIENVGTGGRMIICTSSRFRVQNCDFAGLCEFNTSQDMTLAGSRLTGVYYEEACLDNSITDCRVVGSKYNGVQSHVGGERLHLTRVHISKSHDMALTLEGRENVLESVTVANSIRADYFCYIQGDRTRVTDLTSDVGVVFQSGQRQVINKVQAPTVIFGWTPESPSSGVARDITTASIEMKSNDWTVQRSVAGPAPPR
jgi:hypothetical protein